MSKPLRQAIGLLQLLSFLYSVMFLVHATANEMGAAVPVRMRPLEALGVILLLAWICVVLSSGGRLFREGRPARGLNMAALGLYTAGILLVLRFMPAYHGVLFIRYGGWMFVLALTPLMSVADIVLPPYRRKPPSLA